jgi:hydroxyethylthiazole kinase-like uncharacterized protein yjeF
VRCAWVRARQAYTGPVIYLSRKQSRRVDEIAISELGIPGIVLMENAARGVATAALGMIRSRTARVLLVSGQGNNGGDALAVARLLHNAGHQPAVLTAWTGPLSPDAAVNARIIARMRLPVLDLLNLSDEQVRRCVIESELIIDGLFGTGLTRPIADDRLMRPFVDREKILSIDVPSGLDCDTGLPTGALCVRACATVTLASSKVGYRFPHARAYTGEVTVADIGCPIETLEAAARD